MNTIATPESNYVICTGCNRRMYEGEPATHAGWCPVKEAQERRSLGVFSAFPKNWSPLMADKEPDRTYHFQPVIIRLAMKMWERDKQNGHCKIEKFYEMPMVEIHRYLSYARAAYAELLAIDTERLNQPQGESHE